MACEPAWPDDPPPGGATFSTANPRSEEGDAGGGRAGAEANGLTRPGWGGGARPRGPTRLAAAARQAVRARSRSGRGARGPIGGFCYGGARADLPRASDSRRCGCLPAGTRPEAVCAKTPRRLLRKVGLKLAAKLAPDGRDLACIEPEAAWGVECDEEAESSEEACTLRLVADKGLDRRLGAIGGDRTRVRKLEGCLEPEPSA